MSSGKSKWILDTWRILTNLGPSTEVQALQSSWEEHRSATTLKVAVVGPYDAGKSTLIKRLLVEAGASVPAWLGISGRRETFAVRAASCGPYDLLDTPGLFSGKEDHDDQALEALDLVDVILVVMPPQMLTSGRDQIAEVLSGRRFSPQLPASYISESCIAVVSRMDEAGIDPAENPDGFRSRCRSKLDELAKSLQALGMTRQPLSAHCVVADAYQTVGDRVNTTLSQYAGDPSWDGISGLRADLARVATDLATLREQAGVRFACRVSATVEASLATRVIELMASEVAATNEIDRMEIFLAKAMATESNALARLNMSLEEELLGFERRGKVTDDTKSRLQERFLATIDRWKKESFDELDALIEETAAELKSREGSKARAREGFSADPTGPTDELSDGLGKAAKHLKKLPKAVQAGFRAFAEAKLDMSLAEANKRLKEWEKSGKPLKEFIAERGTKAGFKSLKHAENASRLAKAGKVLDAAGPLLEQLLAAGADIYSDVQASKMAEQDIAKRSAFREELRHRLEEISKDESAEFQVRCDDLEAWLRERQSDERVRVTAIVEERGALKGVIAELRAHLSSLKGI